ncbi:MAG TPA: ABC transporter substrate-binding protein [Pseudolabrys sp.]|nr:ABC transporter substrate-binding protein [Pseudolabrys sp.]
MQRRKFIAFLGGVAFAFPLTALAQQSPRIPRVGIIDDAPIWDYFRQALRDLGYLEGQNIVFEYRTAAGEPERLAQAARELAAIPVDIIVEFGSTGAHAAKKATTTIPIVMISIGDPVRAGFVASLARPGGNMTGNTILGPDLSPKRLQILKEIIPSVSRAAFLWNPDNASNVVIRDELQAAMPKLGMTFISVEVRNTGEFDTAFAAMLREHPDALLMTNDPFHQLHIKRIIAFLAENRIPGMFQTRENVLAGGLISYGASLPDLFRRGASYVHKILQGTRPADLPVEQPTKFELVINVKTAKQLGLTIPESFLLHADDVIE